MTYPISSGHDEQDNGRRSLGPRIEALVDMLPDSAQAGVEVGKGALAEIMISGSKHPWHRQMIEGRACHSTMMT
jgi:hypothetical protein